MIDKNTDTFITLTFILHLGGYSLVRLITDFLHSTQNTFSMRCRTQVGGREFFRLFFRAPQTAREKMGFSLSKPHRLCLLALTLTACAATPTPGCILPTTQPTYTPQPTLTPTPEPFHPTPTPRSPIIITPMPTTPIEFYQDDTGTLEEQCHLQHTATRVGIGFHGLYALDKKTAFLWGVAGNVEGGGLRRSILLKTTDGGRHWIETMLPVVSSDIQQLTFLDNGQGWALIIWTVESTGWPRVSRTQDYGQTWDKPVRIPTSEWYGYSTQMQFFDEQNGQVVIFYDIEDPTQIAFATTSDGGQTWQETRRIFFAKGSPEEKKLVNRYHDWYPHRFESTGRDGVLWKVTRTPANWRYYSGQFIISQQLKAEGEWIVVSALPQYLRCIDGHLALP